MPRKFTPSEITDALAGAAGWAADGDTIMRSFKFANHIEATGFVVRVAMTAEVMDHHPDLRVVYNTVDIRLNSHDAGGVTDRDITLATRINALV
ncbi:MAG: 4a-hydroxytetrahydrobiopterin dehydratase [Dehalococcoidia bacterium]